MVPEIRNRRDDNCWSLSASRCCSLHKVAWRRSEFNMHAVSPPTPIVHLHSAIGFQPRCALVRTLVLPFLFPSFRGTNDSRTPAPEAPRAGRVSCPFGTSAAAEDLELGDDFPRRCRSACIQAACPLAFPGARIAFRRGERAPLVSPRSSTSRCWLTSVASSNSSTVGEREPRRRRPPNHRLPGPGAACRRRPRGCFAAASRIRDRPPCSTPRACRALRRLAREWRRDGLWTKSFCNIR